MTGFLTTMLFMAAFAWPGGGVAPFDADSKCGLRPGGDPDMLEWVAILDLELLEGDAEENTERLASVPNGQVARHHIVCWQWLEANYGVEVRRGGGFTLTKEWMERTRRDRVAALEALVSAQDRHREMTGEYAARIEDLPDFGALSDYGLPDHLQLDLNRTGDSWQARLEPVKEWLSHYRAPDVTYHCFAFAGEVPEGWESMRRDGRPGPAERKPECFEPWAL